MTAGVAKSAVARPPRRNVRGGAVAFSLIEMLVTVVALTLAASIVAPCFPRAFAASRSAGCMNNLHHLGVLLHTETDESLALPGGPVTTVPGASRWTDFVVRNRLERLMLCPDDDDQAMVAIDTCAAFLITITEPCIEIRPLGHRPQWRSASRHWVCKGNPYDADG